MDEFGLIAALAKRLPKPGEDVLLGIGGRRGGLSDEHGAICRHDGHNGRRRSLLPTTITDYNLGYKALAVSVSDVAAMGGRPRFAVVSLAIPAAWDKERLEQVYDGLRENTQRFGCDVIGGDVVSTSGPLVMTTTVIGEAENPIPRSGAKPGDILFVTGCRGIECRATSHARGDARVGHRAGAARRAASASRAARWHRDTVCEVRRARPQ